MITLKVLAGIGLFIWIVVPVIILAICVLIVLVALESGPCHGETAGKDILKFLGFVLVMILLLTTGLDFLNTYGVTIREFFAS